VGFGTIAIFAAWLPLQYLASAAQGRIVSHFAEASSQEAIADAIHRAAPRDVARLQFAILLLLVLPLAAGAFGGGFVVGRWSRRAGPREAVLAGLATALMTCALSWRIGISWAAFAMMVLAIPVVAGAGGWLGARTRAQLAGRTG
jgi:hypothetical protein